MKRKLSEEKKELFVSLYKDIDITRLQDNFFELEYNSSNITLNLRYHFQVYFDALKKQEKKAQKQEKKAQEQEKKAQEQEKKAQEQKKKAQEQEKKVQEQKKKAQEQEKKVQEQEKKKSRIYSLLENNYSETNIDIIFHALPALCTNSNNAINLDTLKILHGNSTLINAGIKPENVIHLLCDLKKVHSTAIDYTKEGNVLILQNTMGELYPIDKIYVRSCYDSIKTAIYNHINTCIAILGDPGIGKSTLLRYIFADICKSKSKQNVYWVMESGQWIYFNGKNTITGSGTSDLWTEKETLLLIDGSFNNIYLAKSDRVVLFCSPEKSNYHKMIKASKGAVFVMPPWDEYEVLELFDFKQAGQNNCTGYNIMLPYYDRLSNFNQDYSSITFNHATIDVGSYNEIDLIPSSNDTENVTKFLRSHVLHRFKLLGGRIRQILNPNTSFSILKADVIKAINSVSIDHFVHENFLSFHGYIPSVLYSIYPADYQLIRPHFELFASDYIRDQVIMRLLMDKSNDLANFFDVLKGESFARSLVGQIFESIVHQKLKHGNSLMGKSLNNNENYSLIIDNNVKVRQYDPEISSLENIDVFTYLIPKNHNFPQVDSIYFSENEIYFLQMTVSTVHPIVHHHLKKLAKSFDIETIHYVYIVPESIYDSFKLQPFHTATNRALKTEITNIYQYVVKFPSKEFNLGI